MFLCTKLSLKEDKNLCREESSTTVNFFFILEHPSSCLSNRKNQVNYKISANKILVFLFYLLKRFIFAKHPNSVQNFIFNAFDSKKKYICVHFVSCLLPSCENLYDSLMQCRVKMRCPDYSTAINFFTKMLAYEGLSQVLKFNWRRNLVCWPMKG